MKETAKVHQAQFLTEMKVPEVMQRQVPMVQEQQKDHALDLKTNITEAQLNRVGSSADTGSSERRRTLHRSSQFTRQRESMKAPPDMKTGRDLRTCLSRGVPADHGARSQVKKKDTCKSEGTQKRPHPKERLCTAEFKNSGTIARVQEKHIRTRRTIAADHSPKGLGCPVRHSESGDEDQK